MLVEDGILDWDRPVRDYMPDLHLLDPAAAEITLRDMLIHRSGLPRHDWVWFPGDRSREDILAALRYLEPSRQFRCVPIPEPPVHGCRYADRTDDRHVLGGVHPCAHPAAARHGAMHVLGRRPADGRGLCPTVFAGERRAATRSSASHQHLGRRSDQRANRGNGKLSALSSRWRRFRRAAPHFRTVVASDAVAPANPLLPRRAPRGRGSELRLRLRSGPLPQARSWFVMPADGSAGNRCSPCCPSAALAW